MSMFWKIFLMSGVFISVVLAGDDDDELCECVLLSLINNVNPVSGYEDAPIQGDLQLNKEESDDDGPDICRLKGKLISKQEVTEGYQINIKIMKENPNGKDLVWSGGADVCQSMGDKDAPWYTLLEPFNTTECPIPENDYEVPGLTMSLGFADSMLTKDYVGTYSIGVTMDNGADKVMGLEIGCEIYAEELPCAKYCPKQKNK